MGMHPRGEPVAAPAGPAAQQSGGPSWTDYIPYYNFTIGLFNKFDKAFVILLGVQNINHGLWTVAVLAC